MVPKHQPPDWLYLNHLGDLLSIQILSPIPYCSQNLQEVKPEIGILASSPGDSDITRKILIKDACKSLSPALIPFLNYDLMFLTVCILDISVSDISMKNMRNNGLCYTITKWIQNCLSNHTQKCLIHVSLEKSL